MVFYCNFSLVTLDFLILFSVWYNKNEDCWSKSAHVPGIKPDKRNTSAAANGGKRPTTPSRHYFFYQLSAPIPHHE